MLKARSAVLRFGLVLLWMSACTTRDSTELVVTVWSDFAIPNEMDEVRIRVAGKEQTKDRPFPLTSSKYPGTYAIPVQLGLVPGGPKDILITLSAIGALRGTDMVWQQAVLPFIPGEKRELVLYLARSCRNISCEDHPGYTCENGACTRPVAVQTAALPVYVPGQVASVQDAATPTTKPDAAVTFEVARDAGQDGRAEAPRLDTSADLSADSVGDAPVAADTPTTLDAVRLPDATPIDAPKRPSDTLDSASDPSPSPITDLGARLDTGATGKLMAAPATAELAAGPGSSSVPLVVNIGNSGATVAGPLTVALVGTDATDFKISGDTCSIILLQPGGICSVSVSYAPGPNVAGPGSARLTVTDQGPGGSVATVTLTGTPVLPAELSITGGPDLGSVAPGAAGIEVEFTVTNSSTTSSGAITVSVSDPRITISNNTCAVIGTLNTGDTCTVGLKLVPPAGSSPSVVSALLQVVAATGTATASVTGAILARASLEPSPTSLSFGSVAVNQASSPQSVTIRNNGGVATGALSIMLTGNGAAQVPIASNTCAASLAPGATCSIVVQYNPTDTTGVNALLTVTDGAISVSIPMVGSGLAPGVLTVSPPSYDFGSRVVGYAGDIPVTFTVGVPSTETGDSGVISGSIIGFNPSDFLITNPCTAPIVPGGSCAIAVSFSPTAVGPRQAVLSLVGARGGAGQVQLEGTGLPVISLVALDAGAMGTGLDFGQYPVGGDRGLIPPPTHGYRVVVRGPIGASITTSVTVILTAGMPSGFNYTAGQTENPCTDVTLNVQDRSASGSNAGHWSYDTASSGMVCDFEIEFYPLDIKGVRSATISASGSSGAADTKTLTGMATGPLVIDPNPMDFGTIAVGSASEQVTMTVLNLASNALGPMTVALAGTDASAYAVAAETCSGVTLGGGMMCTVNVMFTPHSVGAKTSTLMATAGPEVATASITGLGN